jgi:histidinol-phosphate aminotransferase
MNTSRSSSAEAVQHYLGRVLREELFALQGYRVPDASGMVKLDAMENPYRLPAKLRAAIGSRVAELAFNRYPDPAARELKAALRQALHIPEPMEIVLGNGSDEIIQLLALACARPGAVMLGVEPSFAMFPLIARVCGLQFVGMPLAPDFSLQADAVLAALERHRPALTFLAYPNNPTGNLFDARVIERILQHAPGLVVLDEAYHPFAGETFMSRLPEFPNLVVMRTLSKLGLAGLRLGLLAAAPAWVEQFEKLRLPYNINALSQAVAIEVLGAGDVLAAQAADIRAERARLSTRLRAIAGVQAFDSQANFVLFRMPQAQAVYAHLHRCGILVKNLAGSHPALADCLRVTVGTPAENDAFLAAMARLPAESSHA